jgi:hypothetical protein
MIYLLVLIFCSFLEWAFSEPPRKIPSDLLSEFTMDGRIPVFELYLNDTVPQLEFQRVLEDGRIGSFYPKRMIEHYIEKIKRKESFYYGDTDIWLYQALEKYPIKDKTVAIIGSTIPWYESVVIAYGGLPTTIEYNKISTDDERLTFVTPAEFEQNPKRFDVVLSISSVEHDGLGRYGDPINPTADLEFMETVGRKLLKKEGVMILAMPVGRDCLYWNAHRVYGDLRLPFLLRGWHIIEAFGFTEKDLLRELGEYGYQPVFYLGFKHAD